MSQTAFFLILASVVLHAGWHFLSKSRQPRYGFFMAMSTALAAAMSPFLLASGVWRLEAPGRLWLCVLGGGLSGAVYVIGLSYAYRFADIAQAYPLTRALPVLLTAAVTGLTGWGRELGWTALGGMAVISAGCLLLPLPSWRRFRLDAYWNPGMLGILAAVVGSTAYTVIDSHGVRLMQETVGRDLVGAGAYSCLRELTILAAVTTVCLLRREERAALSWDLLRHPHPYLSGVFAGAAYLLVLLAMRHVENVSYVQAFRQMSLPIGFLMGVLLLKEKVTALQVAAVALILGGLWLVYLG